MKMTMKFDQQKTGKQSLESSRLGTIRTTSNELGSTSTEWQQIGSGASTDSPVEIGNGYASSVHYSHFCSFCLTF